MSNRVVVEQVTTSWALIRQSYSLESLGQLLFRRLFTQAPELKRFFSSANISQRQPELMMNSLDAIVNLLQDEEDDKFKSMLLHLGERHAGYGIQESHYTVFGEALVSTLAGALEAKFTNETRQAWQQTYALVRTSMLDGHNSAKGKELATDRRERNQRNAQTTGQLATVSWDLLLQAMPLEEIGQLFYDMLFQKAPELKATLFEGSEMKMQPMVFVRSIDAAVKMLDQPHQLVVTMIQLGERHAGYGVEADHYIIVGDVLLEMMSKQLGEEFTPAMKSAWVKVMSLIQAKMLVGQLSPKGQQLSEDYKQRQLAKQNTSTAPAPTEITGLSPTPAGGNNDTDGYESSVAFQSDVEGTGATPQPLYNSTQSLSYTKRATSVTSDLFGSPSAAGHGDGQETEGGYESSIQFQSDVEGGTTPRVATRFGHPQPPPAAEESQSVSVVTHDEVKEEDENTTATKPPPKVSVLNFVPVQRRLEKDSDSDSDSGVEFETCDEASGVQDERTRTELPTPTASAPPPTQRDAPGTAPTTARRTQSQDTCEGDPENEPPADVRDYSEAKVGVHRIASQTEHRYQQHDQVVERRLESGQVSENEGGHPSCSVSASRSQRAHSEREKQSIELRQRDEKLKALKEAKKRRRLEEEEKRRQALSISSWTTRPAKGWEDATRGGGLSSAELLANNAAQMAHSSMLHLSGDGRSGSVQSILGSMHGGGGSVVGGSTTVGSKYSRSQRQNEYASKVREQHAREWLHRQEMTLLAQQAEEEREAAEAQYYGINHNHPYAGTPPHGGHQPNEDQYYHDPEQLEEEEVADGDGLLLPRGDERQNPAESGTSTVVSGHNSVKAEFEVYLQKRQGSRGATTKSVERVRRVGSMKSEEFQSCRGTSADGSDATLGSPRDGAKSSGSVGVKKEVEEDATVPTPTGEEDEEEEAGMPPDSLSRIVAGEDGDDEDSENELITGGDVALHSSGRQADGDNVRGTERCYLDFQEKYNRRLHAEEMEKVLMAERKKRVAAAPSAFHEGLYRRGLHSKQQRDELYEEGLLLQERNDQYLLEQFRAAGAILHSADGHSIADGEEFTHQLETVRFDPQLNPTEAAAISARLHRKKIGGDLRMIERERKLKEAEFEAHCTFTPRINSDKAPASNPDVPVGDRLFKETVKQDRVKAKLKREFEDRRRRQMMAEMEKSNRHLTARFRRDPELREKMIREMFPDEDE